MKKFTGVLIAVLLLFALSIQAAEVYAPGFNHTGTIGKSTKVWNKGYFDYLYLYAGGSSPSNVTTDTSTSTLTNKTLTAPVIASFYQDAGKTKLMTTPDTASDTLTAIAATQTLTNKTMTTPVLNFGISSKTFTAGEDWTLSESEAKSMFLVLASGSGTPSIIDAYSASGNIKIVRNAANINVICKVSGGTGITVASGKTAILLLNSTDYVRVTADATH